MRYHNHLKTTWKSCVVYSTFCFFCKLLAEWLTILEGQYVLEGNWSFKRVLTFTGQLHWEKKYDQAHYFHIQIFTSLIDYNQKFYVFNYKGNINFYFFVCNGCLHSAPSSIPIRILPNRYGLIFEFPWNANVIKLGLELEFIAVGAKNNYPNRACLEIV